MGVARSSFYAEPEGRPRDEEIVAEIRAITDAFEGYGYRRVDAELRRRGFVVNAGVPRFIAACNERRLHSALGYLSPAQFEHRNARAPVKTAA